MKCVDCSNGAAFGNKYCLNCLKKARARGAKRYAARKAEKKCRTCPNTCDKGILCEECKKAKKDQIDQRKIMGLCVTCGLKKSTTGQKCEVCLTAYRNGRMAARSKRRAEGKCVFCDQPRAGTSLCVKHYLKYTAKMHLGSFNKQDDLLELFNRQNGVCPYTGLKLTLGVDTSIDHIVPKCAGGSLDLVNLQWVYSPINIMKGAMSHEEFMGLVKMIYEKNSESLPEVLSVSNKLIEYSRIKRATAE